MNPLVRTLAMTILVIGLSAAGQDLRSDIAPRDGDGDVDRSTRRQLRREFRQTIREFEDQINGILREESEEFAELLDKEDKSFEEMQQLSELRREFGESSDEAQAVTDEIRDFRESFRDEHGHLGFGPHRPPRPGRPSLSDEDHATLKEHQEALKDKHDQINGILKADNDRYTELVDKEDKTPEDRHELMQQRRELILESEDAQAIVDEIRELNRIFHEENPDIRPHRHPGLRRVKGDVGAIRGLRRNVNELLAEDSSEFATLLEKQDKTPEEMQQLQELRRELIADNPTAQQLRDSIRILKNRIHRPDRHERDFRFRRRSPHGGPDRPLRSGPGDVSPDPGE